MIKNEERVGIVSRLGSNGEGVLKDGDFTVFVPYALPNEKIKYRVLKVKKKVVFAKIVEVYTPAEERVRPQCSVYEKCGGCQLQHLKYKLQLKLKSKIVKDCFSKIAFIDADVFPTERSELEYGYRNKLQLPVRAENFGCEIGFFASGSHRIVPINSCPIQPEWCTRIIKAVKKYVKLNDISVYSDKVGDGLLKHVVVRAVDGKLLITFVINGDTLPCVNQLIATLKEYFNDFSLFVNINKLQNNVILGERFICLFGRDKVTTNDLGVKYEMGPESFMQVNDNVRRRIYAEVVKSSGVDENTVVIDAYSGAGLLTAIFAQRAKKAVGIEIIKEAVDIADNLKRINCLEGKMENVCAPCEDVLPDILRRETSGGEKNVLVLDPPRQGVDEKLIGAILESKPEKILYISCSPQTLARDVGLLTDTLKRENGELVKNDNVNPIYELSFVKPYDMFPQTKHVETLVCLSKKTEKHINIDVEFGEGEGQVSLKKLQEELNEQKPKKKTTYKDIQAYIEEKYGFKVHTAYIAEVKRDLGLPMYDEPNAVEELKRPRSHPTAEMVEAIKDALKYFAII
ncbi:MAG: 23S rRNA (uracil(1939)-C(5))-methyltransferase RlmD [Clostridia bacterium]|nr:23S rRNA (uracil(1939)-C(5))-methyltransferase RlmD [Clostridia bacterium]